MGIIILFMILAACSLEVTTPAAIIISLCIVLTLVIYGFSLPMTHEEIYDFSEDGRVVVPVSIWDSFYRVQSIGDRMSSHLRDWINSKSNSKLRILYWIILIPFTLIHKYVEVIVLCTAVFENVIFYRYIAVPFMKMVQGDRGVVVR